MGELVRGLRESGRGGRAALVRPVRASVRWRMVESVAAVASAPPATELAARSSWRIIAPSSSSSSSRISLAESPSEAPGASTGTAGAGACGSDGGRSRFWQPFSKQTECHGLLLETGNESRILALGHEVMVNDCLLRRQRPLPAYRKRRQIFDFGRLPAYNAAPSIQFIPDKSRKRPHGRTFPIQEHHAPQGRAGCPEVASCSASWRAKSPSPPRWACPIPA